MRTGMMINGEDVSPQKQKGSSASLSQFQRLTFLPLSSLLSLRLSQVKISIGHEFYVTTDEKYAEQGSDKYLYIDYKNLPKKVEVGRNIFIDDGESKV